ncbi:MAG: hypothetical protein LZF62_200024 [Nitrospira sp.]|nr:MAG: hypothetical protein LZF62_200024 [Nitrospira sp.]
MIPVLSARHQSPLLADIVISLC